MKFSRSKAFVDGPQTVSWFNFRGFTRLATTTMLDNKILRVQFLHLGTNP